MSQHSHKYSSSSRFSREIFSLFGRSKRAISRQRIFSTFDKKSVHNIFTIEKNYSVLFEKKLLFNDIGKKIIQWHWRKKNYVWIMFDVLILDTMTRPVMFQGGKAGWSKEEKDKVIGDCYLLRVHGTTILNTKATQVRPNRWFVVLKSEFSPRPWRIIISAGFVRVEIFLEIINFFNFVIKCHKIWQNVIKFVNFCHNFFYNASGVFEIIHWVFSQEPVNGPFSEHMCRYYHLYYR